MDNYSQSCPGPSHGPPTCADKALLTDLLRGQWEWKGYVMSDAGAIKVGVVCILAVCANLVGLSSTRWSVVRGSVDHAARAVFTY